MNATHTTSTSNTALVLPSNLFSTEALAVLRPKLARPELLHINLPPNSPLLQIPPSALQPLNFVSWAYPTFHLLMPLYGGYCMWC